MSSSTGSKKKTPSQGGSGAPTDPQSPLLGIGRARLKEAPRTRSQKDLSEATKTAGPTEESPDETPAEDILRSAQDRPRRDEQQAKFTPEQEDMIAKKLQAALEKSNREAEARMAALQAKSEARLEAAIAAINQQNRMENKPKSEDSTPDEEVEDDELTALKATISLMEDEAEAARKAKKAEELNRKKAEAKAKLDSLNKERQIEVAKSKRDESSKTQKKPSSGKSKGPDDDEEVQKSDGIRNENPLERIEYVHKILAGDPANYLAYVVKFNDDGTYGGISSSIEKDDHSICKLTDINNPKTVCPVILLIMMLEKSNEVIDTYGTSIAQIFSEEGGITNEIAEQILYFSTLGTPKEDEAGLTMAKYLHHPSFEKGQPNDPATAGHDISLEIVCRGLHATANLMIQHENMALHQRKAKQENVNALRDAQTLVSDAQNKVLVKLKAVTNENVNTELQKVIGKKVLPTERIVTHEFKSIWTAMDNALKEAGYNPGGWYSQLLEHLSLGAQLKEYGSTKDFREIYKTGKTKTSNGAPSNRPGQDVYAPTDDGTMANDGKGAAQALARLFHHSPHCAPHGNGLQVQPDLISSLSGMVTGTTCKYLDSNMMMTHCMGPLIRRAQQLHVCLDDVPGAANMITIIDGVESKAAELILERLKRVERVSKNKRIKNVCSIINGVIKSDRRRRDGGNNMSTFAGAYLHDPYTILLRACDPARHKNIGLASFCITVINSHLSEMNQNGQTNSRGMTGLICAQKFEPSKETPMSFLESFNEQVSIVRDQVINTDHPGPLFTSDDVFQSQMMDWASAEVFRVPMLHPSLSESETAKYKKLKKAHDDKVEQYLKDNPDADKSLVLSSVYGTLRKFIVAHREALSKMVVVKSANQSTSNLSSGSGIPLDADALNMVADELNDGTVMLGNGAPSGRDSDSGNSKRRKKKSDALNANGTMSATVTDFVNASDKLASVLHAVTAKKSDDSKSSGKSKGRKNNKAVPPEIASKMMKAFGFGAPKELCGRNDIGTKLINDPDAKKQIIMFPWINNGEFRDLDASELKDWAIKLGYTTEEEYQQMCKDIMRTSFEKGGNKSFHFYNYRTLYEQIENAPGDAHPSQVISTIKDFCKRREGKSPDEAMVFLSKAFHDTKGSEPDTKSGEGEQDEPEDEQQDSSSSSGQSSDKSGVGTNKSGNGTSKSSGETSGTISGSSSVSALTETSSNDELAQKIEYERLKFENLKIQQELASGKSGAKGAEDSKPGALETALNGIDLTNPEVQKLMNAKMAEIQELTRAKNLAGQRASLAGGTN